MNYFDESKYLLIEASDIHFSKLSLLSEKYENIQIAMCAAGDEKGFVNFICDESDIYSGAVVESANCNKFKVKEVAMNSIDNLVQKYSLNGPYLLKLDTHGYEVPILRGAKKTLEQCEVIIMEVYNFNMNGNLKFYEITNLMEEYGFSCVSLVDPLFREKDKALWQIDLIYLKSSHEVFTKNTYR